MLIVTTWYLIFLIGDPNLNLHLPLFFWEGVTTQTYTFKGSFHHPHFTTNFLGEDFTKFRVSGERKKTEKTLLGGSSQLVSS